MADEKRTPSDGEMDMVELFCDNLQYAETAMEKHGIDYAYGYLLGCAKGFLIWLRTQYDTPGGNDERER